MKIQNFINGDFAEPISGNYFDNITPVTGEVYAQIPDSDSSDIDLAVSSAKEAFKSWSKLSKNERYDHIMHLADEI
ncbi:MAG TPA: aldehyde dehydrogenase family protein, partial [Candidatus Marinimicrobia bacterium]|nr:aldehyde dehydrogenase family protein [Candidatus Neomarinimicrobiota bacterium]